MAKKKSINLKSKVQRKDQDLIANEIEGELVMMNLKSGKYFGLNLISTRIWELIEKPVSLHQLVSQLRDEYKVTQEKCEQEVSEFIVQLKDLKMVRMHDEDQ